MGNDWDVDVDVDAHEDDFGVEGDRVEIVSDRRPLQDSRGCSPTLWSSHHTIVYASSALGKNILASTYHITIDFRQ